MKNFLVVQFSSFSILLATLFATGLVASADDSNPNDPQQLALSRCVSVLAPRLSGPYKASMAQTYCEAYGPEVMTCALKYEEWVMVLDGGITKSIKYCQKYSRQTLECAEKLAPNEMGYDKFKIAIKDCLKK